MKTIIILVSLLLSGWTTSKFDGIRSQVSIINRVDPQTLKVNSGRFYSVKINLINETDTTLSFWTMSCSWENNWVTEDKAIGFFIHCPKNTPQLMRLEPGKIITYNGIIELQDTANFNSRKELRLGFVLIKKNEVHKDGEFRTVLYKKIDAKKDIFWSEPFRIDK